jgi:predicted component of viral defense system (DUF524 family)
MPQYFTIISPRIFSEMVRNVVDIVGKRSVIIHIEWKTNYTPAPQKTAVWKTVTKIFVQPNWPLSTAQRIFDLYDE